MIRSSRVVTEQGRHLARNATITLILSTLLLSSCGVGVVAPTPRPSAASPAAQASSPTPAPTPSPTPAPQVWPLTGLMADDLTAIHRRPLNVRLPNDRAARPLVGLSKADLVFEMIVEGGVTRYAAVYHSQQPKSVGPVRSYRWSDLHLTQMLRGIIVSSGATTEERDAATTSMRAGNLITVDNDRVDAPYFRVGGRPAPNDLFADLAKARDAAAPLGGNDPVDVPALSFLPAGDHEATGGGFSSSTPATAVTIPFQRDPTTFTYDDAAAGYRRKQSGATTVDPDGNEQILARNVIVMHTDIWETSVKEDLYGSLGLEYRMTGGGKAEVFRDGRRLEGTWKRDSVLDQFAFYDQAGARVLLDPGQSWIHFVYPAWVIASTP